MKPEPFFDAIDTVQGQRPPSPLTLTSNSAFMQPIPRHNVDAAARTPEGGRAKRRRRLPRKKSLRYIGSRDHATIELSEEEDDPGFEEEREQPIEAHETERAEKA